MTASLPAELPITELAEPDAEQLDDRIDAVMTAFNTEHLGDERERRTVLAAHDAEGRLAGGLVAWSCWDYLYLQNLWVDPAHRGQGLGQRLVAALEAWGRERGFRMIQLYTFSFEAPRFYEQLGYTLAGRIEDAPTGTTNHWFFKRL